MKNLTEGEKMVWAAVYAAALFVADESPQEAARVAHRHVALLRSPVMNAEDAAFETAKEVLK